MSHYLNNRVLKFNVGYLLHDGPAHSQDSELDLPAVRVADDLLLNHVRGPLRLSRTTEGILLQSELAVGFVGECYRCLEPVDYELAVSIEELFSSNAKDTAEFSVGDDAILDFNPLLRAEVLIQSARGVLCQPDCKGLCPDCGVNRNHETCQCENERIDPRFAALKKLLDSQ